jgi:hypothetical protein
MKHIGGPSFNPRREGLGRSGNMQNCKHRLILGQTTKLVSVLVVAASMVSLVASPAGADIRACREQKPPRNESEALSRAGFAFDGIVVAGRTVRDPKTGMEVVVSPLTFRVINSLKGRVFDYSERTASGEILIDIWDAEYAFGGLRRKVMDQRGPDVRIRRELATVQGARWRIYALNQVGNWTATTCLGSHLIRESSGRNQSESGTRDNPLPSDFANRWVWFLVGLGSAGAIALLLRRIVRSRRVT